MAGRGPAPKAQRQRRGAPTRGDWIKLEPLDAPLLPELSELGPPPADLEDWPYATRLLWEAWREDPVTSTWNASDRALAVDTIILHAAAALAKANEVRLRIDGLGLSPKGRRDLRLLLPDEEPPEDETLPDPPALRVLPEAK